MTIKIGKSKHLFSPKICKNMHSSFVPVMLKYTLDRFLAIFRDEITTILTPFPFDSVWRTKVPEKSHKKISNTLFFKYQIIQYVFPKPNFFSLVFSPNSKCSNIIFNTGCFKRNTSGDANMPKKKKTSDKDAFTLANKHGE